MGWGKSTAGISKSTNNSVTVAEKLNQNGDIDEMRSYGGKTEIQEEVYIDASAFTNEAVNGQSGSSVISAHNLIESNTDFCRSQKTTVTALTAATTTT